MQDIVLESLGADGLLEEVAATIETNFHRLTETEVVRCTPLVLSLHIVNHFDKSIKAEMVLVGGCCLLGSPSLEVRPCHGAWTKDT